MKNKERIIFYCSLVVSVCFFISAIIHFFSNETKYLFVEHLFFGAAFLCLASAHKKDKDKDEK